MPSNVKFRTFHAAVSVMGLAALAISVPSLPFAVSVPRIPLDAWEELVFFGLLCAVAQSMPIPLFRSSSVSVSAAVTLAGLVLYGPAAALWINTGSSLVSAFRPKPKPFDKIIFNTGMHALAASMAGAAYFAAGGTIRPEDPVWSILPILVASVFYFVTQTFLISGVIALQQGISFGETWDTNFRWTALNFVALGVIGLGMASTSMSMGITGVAIFSIPLVMTRYSLQLYMGRSRAVRAQNEALRIANEKLEASYLSTIRALAAAIDAKDPYTHGHSEITMRYSVAIAREMGLDEDQVGTVHIAALLHDVGKIGMPDGVLNKPARLTDEERSVMMEHPVVGAKLILQVDLLGSAVEAVEHHHERYDGKGYPSGLKGDEIPLWSQIISVADSFQAMTSSRPYRPGLSIETGLEELRRCAGTQFSPRVVVAMEKVIKSGKWAQEVTPPHLPRAFQVSAADVFLTGG